MFLIKNFYDKGQTALATIILIIPMVLYKIYTIYQRKQQEEYQNKMNLMMAQFQALQQQQQQQAQQTQQYQQGKQNNQQYNEFNRSMQLNPNSPQNQESIQTTLQNPKQHHYNELNTTLQVTQNNNQEQNPQNYSQEQLCQNSGVQTRITQNYRPKLESRSININGQSESQFLEDTIKQEDFSPNYNEIQSGAIIETLNTGSGINAFDNNNYLNPSYESLF